MNNNPYQTLAQLDKDFSSSKNIRSTFYNNKELVNTAKRADNYCPDTNQAAIDEELLDNYHSQPPYNHPRFQVLNWLAKGSFGEIWEGMDKKLKRKVAIKCFFGKHEEAYQSFKNEIKYLQYLEHPGIPAILDISPEHETHPYLVMQYISGQTLKEVIDLLRLGDPETHQKYTFTKRVDLIIQVLRILSQVHQEGIIHRDIKPANIMIGHTDEVYLMDWGIAINYQEETIPLSMTGTPLYMAPEQYLMQGITPKSDLYALAAVSYEFLSLKTTVDCKGSIYQLGMSILDGQFKNMSHLYHDTQGHPPSEFDMAVMKALATDPNERPYCAEQMKTMLERALAGHIDIICTRTFIKRFIFKALRWIDHNPYKNVPIMVLLILGGISMFIGLGIYIGS